MTQMRWQCATTGCWLQRRTDPVIFDGCFPPGVGMGDIDGIVELDGHFLVVEFKRNGRVPAGQATMHRRLVGLGCFTVIVVTALEQHVTGWTTYSARHPEGITVEGGTEELRRLVAAWTRKTAPRRAPAQLAATQRPVS